MSVQRASLQPTKGGRVLTIRLRIAAAGVPAGAGVQVTDVMLQPGGIASGWMAHATERPWVAGIAGGP